MNAICLPYLGKIACEGYTQKFGDVLYRNGVYALLKPEVICTKMQLCHYERKKLDFDAYANEILNLKKAEKTNNQENNNQEKDE